MPNQVVPAADSAAGLQARLDLIKTLLAAGHVKLYKDSFAPTVNSPLADFVANEADYTGYAGVVPTFSADALDADGGYLTVTNRLFFQCTADSPGNGIGGLWIETSVPALYEFFPLNSPVNLSTNLAFLAAVLYIREPNPDYGQVES